MAACAGTATHVGVRAVRCGGRLGREVACRVVGETEVGRKSPDGGVKYLYAGCVTREAGCLLFASDMSRAQARPSWSVCYAGIRIAEQSCPGRLCIAYRSSCLRRLFVSARSLFTIAQRAIGAIAVVASNTDAFSFERPQCMTMTSMVYDAPRSSFSWERFFGCMFLWFASMIRLQT